jgi:membrane protease YdiL (CAAX protease family)/Pyruvate/2-oxoacid:ferredoxin oxidoreductase delta subunit
MSATTTPLRLETTACNRCGRCAPLCTSRALRIGPGYIYVDWDLCDGCGTCAAACDTGAISLRQGKASAAPAPSTAGAASHGHGAGAKAVPAPKPAAGPARAAAAPGSPGVPEWSLPEAALVLVVAFALLVGAQAFVSGLAGAPVWSGVALVCYDLALVALLWYLARRRGVAAVTAYRLDTWPEWTSALYALAIAVACWLFSVTYRAVVLGIGLHPPASAGTDLPGLFGPGTVGAVLTVIVVAVLGPALEEVLLRGVVMGALRGRIGMWPAIGVSAVVFALLHASVWSLLPLTVLGVGLGWLAARSRSLWPAIAAHVLYNGVLVAAALYAAAH